MDTNQGRLPCAGATKGRIDTNQYQVPLLRGKYSNPSPHDIPPRGGPLFFFRGRGTNFPIGGNPWQNFWSQGRMDTIQGRAPLRRVNHSNPSPHDISPRGVTLAIFPVARAQIIPYCQYAGFSTSGESKLFYRSNTRQGQGGLLVAFRSTHSLRVRF